MATVRHHNDCRFDVLQLWARLSHVHYAIRFCHDLLDQKVKVDVTVHTVLHTGATCIHGFHPFHKSS
jgi:hypothetical protein